MKRTDFLLGENGDLQIQDGDLVTGVSDNQNIELILKSVQGEFKQFPLLGVGIDLDLNGAIDGGTKRTIRLQLDSDQYKLLNLTFSNNGMNIHYESN